MALVRLAPIFLTAFCFGHVFCADSPESHFQLAGKYMEQGNFDKAVEEYNKILEAGIKHPQVYNNLALAYSRTADGSVNAIENFKKAIELNPQYNEAYLNLGSVYISKGEYKNAVANFKQAIHINPNYARSYFALGWACLMGKIDITEAIKAFKMAIKLEPNYPESYLGLGLAFVAAGNKELALEPITFLRAMNRSDLAAFIENAIKTGEASQVEALQKTNNLQVKPQKKR